MACYYPFGHCIVCPSRLMACYYPFGHCIVCPSKIYGLLLPLWPLYCLSFRFMACYYPFGHCIVCPSQIMACYYPFGHCIVCPLRFMACYYPFGHCIVCPSKIYGLLLPLWSLYCLSFSDLWLVITPLAIVLSVLRFMACYYPFGHCIVCPSQIDGLLLPSLAIVLSVLLRFMACYYPFGHCIVCPSQSYGLLLPLWSLYYFLSSDLWLVITPLVIVLSVLLRFMACYYPFGHCIICPSPIYGLLLPLWPLYCLSFSD